QHFSAGPHHHTVFQCGVTLSLVPGGATQGNAVVQGAVVADFGGFTDHHAHTMVNKKTPADGGAGVNFETGKPAADGRHPARQPYKASQPQPVRQPVMHNSMQTRVSGQHFKGIAGGRVALEYAGDVFTQVTDTQDDSPCLRGFCIAASIPRRIFTSILSGAARWYRRRNRLISCLGVLGSRKPVSIRACSMWVNKPSSSAWVASG